MFGLSEPEIMALVQWLQGTLQPREPVVLPPSPMVPGPDSIDLDRVMRNLQLQRPQQPGIHNIPYFDYGARSR